MELFANLLALMELIMIIQPNNVNHALLLALNARHQPIVNNAFNDIIIIHQCFNAFLDAPIMRLKLYI